MTKIHRRITGAKLGESICKALGVDPTNVSEVKVTAHCNDLAYVDITLVATEDDGEALVNVLSEYYKPRYVIVPHEHVVGHYIIKDTRTGVYCGGMAESEEELQLSARRMNNWER